METTQKVKGRAGISSQSAISTIILSLVALLVSATFVLASDVSSALWRGEITIINEGDSTATGVSVNMTLSSPVLVESGYATANLSDTAMQINGVDTAFMPGANATYPWIFFVPSISAETTTYYDLFSSGASGGHIRYFPSSTGMSSTDNTNLELSDNFTIEVKGYVNTGNGSSKNLVNKFSAFRIQVTDDEEITAGITDNTSWVTPTGHYDPNSDWTNETYAYDDNLATEATTSAIGTLDWSEFLELSHSPITIDSVRFYVDDVSNYITKVDVDAYYNDTWNHVYEDTGWSEGVWEVCPLASPQSVNNTRVRIWNNDNGSTHDGLLQEFDYGQPTFGAVQVTATGISNGEHTIKATIELATETFYPNASPETVSVDGYANHYQLNQTWNTIVNGAGTASNDSSASAGGCYWRAGNSEPLWRDLRRSLYLFDTSSLDNSTVIVSAVLSLYGESKSDPSNNTPDINIYSSNPASDTAVAAGDYDSVGAIAFCDTPITYANWNTSGYNDFTFNATGIASVNLTGVSYYGARNANYDTANSSPPNWGNSLETWMFAYFAEQGDGYKPRLTVTYWDLKIYIDDVEEDNIVLGSGSVPDNTNGWVFLENDAMPYMEHLKIWVGGSLQQHIEWEYTTGNFTDLSGNSHGAFPTFRTTSSSANVSATLSGFAPVDEAALDTYSLVESYSILTANATLPSGAYDELDVSRIPGGAAANELLAEGDIPQAAWWFPFLFIGICVVGMIIYGATTLGRRSLGGGLAEGKVDGSLLIMFIVMETALAVLGIMGVLPKWPFMIFPIAGIAIIISRKHYSWG